MIDSLRAPYGALLLRVSMGVLFILHGLYLKATVFGMAGAGKYFASLGLPDWFAWVVVAYETLGGLALIFGVYARWVAVFLGVHLLFAAYLGHLGNGWMFTAKGRSEEHTSELQSLTNLVCRLLLEKKKDMNHSLCHHSNLLHHQQISK